MVAIFLGIGFVLWLTRRAKGPTDIEVTEDLLDKAHYGPMGEPMGRPADELKPPKY